MPPYVTIMFCGVSVHGLSSVFLHFLCVHVIVTAPVQPHHRIGESGNGCGIQTVVQAKVFVMLPATVSLHGPRICAVATRGKAQTATINAISQYFLMAYSNQIGRQHQ
jgi:hypothetical protein